MPSSIQGEVSGSSVTTAGIADNTILNEDINTGAAIAFSKLAALTSGNIIVGSAGNVPTAVAMSGDVTIVAAGTTTIGAAKVTEAMQVLADNTTQDVSTTKHGYAPKAPNNTTTFLRGDATWAAAGGGAVSHKASGTIALQAATTTYDVDYVDISFSASELAAGDNIEIVMQGQQTTQNMYARFDLKNTTSNPNGTEGTLGSGNLECNRISRLCQSAQDTSIISIININGNDQTITMQSYDSGDDNIFTTAFDLRINLRNSASSNARTVRYKVTVIKSS